MVSFGEVSLGTVISCDSDSLNWCQVSGIFVTEFLLISWRNVQFGNSSDLPDDGKGDEHL